jgi:hypothetical protein
MVVPIPDWLIDQARGVQEAVRMDQTCTIKRRVMASNGAGGRSRSSVTTHGPYPCSVGPSSAAIGEMLAQRKVVTTGLEQVITLPAGTSVLMTDQIAIGADTFEVVDVAPASRRQTALRVVARRTG